MYFTVFVDQCSPCDLRRVCGEYGSMCKFATAAASASLLTDWLSSSIVLEIGRMHQ